MFDHFYPLNKIPEILSLRIPLTELIHLQKQAQQSITDFETKS